MFDVSDPENRKSVGVLIVQGQNHGVSVVFGLLMVNTFIVLGLIGRASHLLLITGLKRILF